MSSASSVVSSTDSVVITPTKTRTKKVAATTEESKKKSTRGGGAPKKKVNATPEIDTPLENTVVPTPPFNDSKDAVVTTAILIELTNPSKMFQFKTIFQNVKTFSKEINIYVNVDSFYVQTLDTNKASVFELTLPASWFDRWIVPKNAVIGILTTLFFNILNLAEHAILIQYNAETQSDKLMIQLQLEKCILEYELPLMDIECEMMEIPEAETNVDCKMKSVFFFTLVDKLKKFGGDEIVLSCTEEMVVLSSKTMEAGSINAQIQIADLTEYAIGGADTIRSAYAMNYMYNIAIFYKVAEFVEVHLSIEQPLKVVFMLGDDANVLFYLAPKFGEGEDS
jgi:proliferating cell nuclear antigen PCNA